MPVNTVRCRFGLRVLGELMRFIVPTCSAVYSRCPSGGDTPCLFSMS
jgi:hypothetical protein